MYEIERKFLIRRPLAEVVAGAARSRIEQCYLPGTGDWAIRARKRVSADKTAYVLTMKKRQSDRTNVEIETVVTEAMYKQIEAVCGHEPLAKNRYVVGRWEIDEFLNPELEGLIVAEIELKSETEAFDPPAWLGEEVTGKYEYANASIARRLGVVAA